MALVFARDSYGDLSEIQRKLQEEKEIQAKNGDKSNSKSNGMISLLWKKNTGTHDHDISFYEFCQDSHLEGDNESPIWEMTSESTLTTKNKIIEGSRHSILECERIFTVPEIYYDLQQHHSRQNDCMIAAPQECNFLDCLVPWKKQKPGPDFSRDVRLPIAGADDEDCLSQKIEHPGVECNRNTPKGIMRRTSMAVQMYLGMPAAKRQYFTPSMYKIEVEDSLDSSHDRDERGGEDKRRVSFIGNSGRNIFTVGSIEENDKLNRVPHSIGCKKDRRVHFSELKRVLKIRKFTPDEALDVWFQREDFDHFKAEMTLLIQETEANKELAEDWLLDPEEVQRRRSNASLNELGHNYVNGDENKTHINRSSTSSIGSASNCTKSRAWWHDYDHSRRGLERYASPGQARQILASYKVAVQKVLDEQRRQRMVSWFCFPNAKDPKRIAEIYHEYTSWSRDLALAAAASDADAVKTNFDDETRKTREYFLLKQVIQSGYRVHKHMPQFMLPKCITPKGFLDESESLYDDRSRYLGGVMKMASNKFKSQTKGEKEREEMSNLHLRDLEGPVAPALVPIIKADRQDENRDGEIKRGVSDSPTLDFKQKSMASKARNFPFQK
mmetsp:Transcript_17326/g.36159  ORF Transcript_17326/g.36159 Transcript_17326/m.36159 type:complete len:612 (+) Transcript_17326:190-2025(+)|eukprot:CAMPEP_0171334302 /NCGR_PEP_ID=MMETSP0878-20121228/4574_1 /TAXON_ID=67004 /ORGANISM="Thalassiosira weissflogii, Strain CCMP1336" /LENGTH=611 /DNA_ID=CAMNT_0011835373 /DNA_START=109 /DNA_END=1944 /DNA_ORIENTATION=-